MKESSTSEELRSREPPKLAWWHLHRRLYNWVLSWAHTPYGMPALFVLAFAEASVLPAVPPDVLLIALAFSRRARSFVYAAVCSVGSVLGGMTGYLIGYALWTAFAKDLFIPHVFSQATFDKVAVLYDKWDFLAVFAAGLTPLPYIAFCVGGGVAKINFATFVLASVVSRSARFFGVAALIWFFGAPIKKFIEKYFNLMCVVFFVLLAGGILAVKYLL